MTLKLGCDSFHRLGIDPFIDDGKLSMDPAPLTNFEWTEINRLLTNLWIMVALVIFFSTNLLVGHILIPSLVASYDLPSSIQKTRPGFYILALAGFIAVIGVLVVTIDIADVIPTIFDTYWIDGGVD